MQLFTDASGTYSWCAYWNGKLLQGKWLEAQLHMDITWKELFAIIIAMAVHTYLGITVAKTKGIVLL